MCLPGCRFHLFTSCVGCAVPDVFEDRFIKEHRFLCHNSDLVPQFCKCNVSNRSSIQKNASIFRIVKTRQQVDECRLATSVLPDNGNHFTKFDIQVDMFKHQPSLSFWILAFIAERDVLEFNRLLVSSAGFRNRWVRDTRFAIDQIEYPVNRSCWTFQAWKCRRHFSTRIKHSDQHKVQRCQFCRTHDSAGELNPENIFLASQYQISPRDHSNEHRSQTEKLQHRLGGSINFDDLQGFLEIGLILFRKLVLMVLLVIEGNNDFQSREALFQDFINLRHAFHHPAAGSFEEWAEFTEE